MIRFDPVLSFANVKFDLISFYIRFHLNTAAKYFYDKQ